MAKSSLGYTDDEYNVKYTNNGWVLLSLSTSSE